jgi:hypothetical protein
MRIKICELGKIKYSKPSAYICFGQDRSSLVLLHVYNCYNQLSKTCSYSLVASRVPRYRGYSMSSVFLIRWFSEH